MNALRIANNSVKVAFLVLTQFYVILLVINRNRFGAPSLSKYLSFAKFYLIFSGDIFWIQLPISRQTFNFQR